MPRRARKKEGTEPAPAVIGKLALAQRELSARLLHLRSAVRTVSRVYLANQEKAIVDLIEWTKRLAPKPANVDLAQELVNELKELTLKPEKGRRKDLRRVEDMLTIMEDMIRRRVGKES